jgi:hypothetical protein
MKSGDFIDSYTIWHFLIIFCALAGFTYVHFFEPSASTLEQFSNALSPGEYPEADQYPLLKGVYPLAKSAVISNDGVQDIWKKQGPDLTLSGFNQSTNNVWNGVSPDNGSCTPAQFCGSFYAQSTDKNKRENKKALEPVPYGDGARVNFVRNVGPNLLQFNYKENVMY